MKEVVIAENSGACFGVERALKMVRKAAQESHNVMTLGPLIHNPQVISELEAQSVSVVKQLEDAKDATLVLRTHGSTPHEEAHARALCSQVIDATCPFVKRVHTLIEEMDRDGFEVVVVGEKGHPEVEASLGHAKGARAIQNREEAEAFPCVNKLGVVVQTTLEQELLDEIIAVLETKTRELRFENTICAATKERQSAAKELALASDVMIVIGGRNSANTKHLASICAKYCPSVHHIESPHELDSSWFSACKRIGITAGASTPKEQIEGLYEAIQNLIR